MIYTKKRDGENVNSVLFRFGKRIKQSGVLKEAKFRRFRKRDQNRRARKLSALYQLEKAREVSKARKYGQATR